MMEIQTKLPDLQQVTFFPGQRLTASELNEGYRVLREMRWLHNRSLHDWGIGLGLGVQGRPGDAQVTVAPGYALDTYGRELIVTEAQVLKVPATAGGPSATPVSYLLVVSYPADEDVVLMMPLRGECLPGGSSRQFIVPRLRWLPVASPAYRPGFDVVLAQAWVRGCRLAQALSFNLRRSARMTSSPYISSGRTIPADTTWEILQPTGALVGLSTEVNTSEAGFQATPVYQAQIMGTRLAVAEDSQDVQAVIDGFTHLDQATPRSFRLTITLPQGFTTPGGVPLNPSGLISPDAVQQLGWHVTWMGIEGP